MKFTCNQNWDSMKVTSNGRYCDVCKKEVHNFTNKSVTEINAIKSSYGELCGRFNVEQIEPDLIPIDFAFAKKLKYAAATIATFLGLELNQAKAQTVNENPTELNSENGTITTNENIQNGKCVQIVKEDVEEEIEEQPNHSVTKKRHRYYLSKRFPFIKKRRYRTMGAMF